MPVIQQNNLMLRTHANCEPDNTQTQFSGQIVVNLYSVNTEIV